MGWFCNKYQICAQCRVHFEPDRAARHPELCPEHRKPVVELELRKELVARWAQQNWETLEPQAKEDEAKRQIYTYSLVAHGGGEGPATGGIGSGGGGIVHIFV